MTITIMLMMMMVMLKLTMTMMKTWLHYINVDDNLIDEVDYDDSKMTLTRIMKIIIRTMMMMIMTMMILTSM